MTPFRTTSGACRCCAAFCFAGFATTQNFPQQKNMFSESPTERLQMCTPLFRTVLDVVCSEVRLEERTPQVSNIAEVLLPLSLPILRTNILAREFQSKMNQRLNPNQTPPQCLKTGTFSRSKPFHLSQVFHSGGTRWKHNISVLKSVHKHNALK
jgi:hypothetical protein